MNWRTYKTLNEKQKEEYNYRFKDHKNINLKNSTYSALVFMGMSTTMMLTSFVMLQTNTIDESTAILLFNATFPLLSVIGWFILLQFIMDFGSLCWYWYGYIKWRKSEAITFIPPWKKE